MYSESAWLSSGLTLHAALEFQVHIAKGDGSTLSIPQNTNFCLWSRLVAKLKGLLYHATEELHKTINNYATLRLLK